MRNQGLLVYASNDGTPLFFTNGFVLRSLYLQRRDFEYVFHFAEGQFKQEEDPEQDTLIVPLELLYTKTVDE